MWLVELAEADEEIQNHRGQVLLTIYYFWKLRTPKTRRFDLFRFGFFLLLFSSVPVHLRQYFSIWSIIGGRAWIEPVPPNGKVRLETTSLLGTEICTVSFPIPNLTERHFATVWQLFDYHCLTLGKVAAFNVFPREIGIT